ncbi:MAG: SUMF1/EgtB/PvdO family nonheme iron enzyme [Chloroflexota bacterium]
MTTVNPLVADEGGQPPSGNPYHYDTPVRQSQRFFGRETIFDQIGEYLRQRLAEPLLLVGQEHSGKSSLLQQLMTRHLSGQLILDQPMLDQAPTGQMSEADRPPLVTLIDLAQTAVDSLSLLLWDIAKTAVADWSQPFAAAPSLDKTYFSANPLSAFHDQCLDPFTTAGQSQPAPRRLLLGDNLDALLPALDNKSLNATLLNQFFEMLLEADVALILTCTASGKAALTHHLPILHQAPILQIGPLDKEAALDLIRQPTNYAFVQDVAEYIYELTQGHAYQIQRLCHNLFRYRQETGLGQFTIADVAHVAAQAAGQPATWQRHLPTYTVAGNGRSAFRTRLLADNQPSNRDWLIRVGLLLLVILLLAGAALGYANQQQPLANQSDPDDPNLLAALAQGELPLIPTATPSATPSPTSTSTSQPTPTATATPLAASPTPTPTATATPTPSPTPDGPPPEITRQSDQMIMVYIPPGTFIRGADEDDLMADTDERPQHEITLDGFYIDKYEVSVAQFVVFLNRRGGLTQECNSFSCALPRLRVGATSYLVEQDLSSGEIQYIPLTGYANYPINHVSWYGANAYCEAVGGRLPTEAEWEYAARGTDGRLYPWGNQLPNPTRAVFASEDYENLKPVDALPAGASPFGVFGMAGSMWEWVADWYDATYYDNSPQVNPPGPESGFFKVIRGGAWPNNNQANRIRASNRNVAPPDFISSTIGFRCAYDWEE